MAAEQVAARSAVRAEPCAGFSWILAAAFRDGGNPCCRKRGHVGILLGEEARKSRRCVLPSLPVVFAEHIPAVRCVQQEGVH